jgi:transglutaminase-like putative cysteine protease
MRGASAAGRVMLRMLVACALQLAAAAAARADWALVEEHFHALSLAGHPCGRSHERVERDGDRVRTLSRIEMRFARLGQETVIDLSSEFVETARGEAIEATVRQKGAETVRYVFETQRRARVERGAAREFRELADDAWLTPREVAAFVKARGSADAGEIRFRTLDVQSGFVVAEVTMKRTGAATRDVEGRTLTLARYEVRNSLQPIVANELYDADGILHESSTPLGLGELVSRRASRAQADEAFARASFDLLAGTFVEVPPIARWRERRTLRIEIEATVAGLEELPSVGSQRFTRLDARRATIDVDVDARSAAAAEDDADARWRKPNELIDSDSEPVRALLADARLAKDTSRAQRAEALRALVARHLRAKNLATAFGAASEAARTRSGDCTEHAVLLAALLRAEGIPSRVASGLVYVPSLAAAPGGASRAGWGWHLWTQALVEGPADAAGGFAWLDLDATVSGGDRGYHAGHLLVATSDLAGGATDPAFARALSLIGGLRIREVPEGRAP